MSTRVKFCKTYHFVPDCLLVLWSNHVSSMLTEDNVMASSKDGQPMVKEHVCRHQ